MCDFPAVHLIFIEQTVLKSGTSILIHGKSATWVPRFHRAGGPNLGKLKQSFLCL